MGYGVWADVMRLAAIRASRLIASSLLTSNLSPLTFCLIASFPANRQCFDADAKQMQERYEVARVKTDG